MKIYYRYVLGGVTKLFVTTLLIFTVALLFLLVVQMSLKTGFPFTYSFRLTPYLVPEIFAIAIPASALFAVTIFFAKMGGNNEIIGLKSLGIAPWRILYPVWILMFGVSVCGVWFNDLSTSWTRLEMNRVLLEGVETMLLSQLRTENRFVAPSGQFEVKVTDVTNDNVLINPEFSGKIDGVNGTAESAKVNVEFDSTKNPLLRIHMENAEIDAQHGRLVIPDSYEFVIPLNQIYRSKNRVDPPAKEVKQALENLEADRSSYHRRLASSAIFSFLSGDFEATTQESWKTRINTEKYFDRQRNRFKLTIPRICAAGFSTFFFVWVGAPYSIFLRKSDVTFAFFTSFLPILFVYYPLFALGLEGAKSGTLPPVATWLGNVALGIIGIFFLKKIH